MKLEDQVCSLQLAQRLKELGIPKTPQTSLFYWTGDEVLIYGDQEPVKSLKLPYISAFTVAELGELLPGHIEKNGTTFCLRTAMGKNLSKKWCVYQDGQFNMTATPFIETESNTEADCRAQMLIYLLENKLIEI